MSIYRLVSTQVSTSGVPKDNVVNVFHVDAIGYSLADHHTPITAAWQTFMRAMAGNIAGVTAGPHTLVAYSMAEAPPRAPVAESTWTYTAAPSGTIGPREIALCISFQAARESGEPQRRRRGRMYWGPLSTSFSGAERPSSTLRGNLANGFQTFANTVNAITGVDFVVYSRVLNEGNVVTNAWVDDAWDVQRRRGNAATTRTTVSITS